MRRFFVLVGREPKDWAVAEKKSHLSVWQILCARLMNDKVICTMVQDRNLHHILNLNLQVQNSVNTGDLLGPAVGKCWGFFTLI
jgi:hypothetical protein